MRVALLSDIHANAEALAAVLASARRQGVERLIVAGDLVGYYYAADEVISLLDEFEWDCVRGNHEDMLARWCAGSDREAILRKYGSGLAAASEVLSARDMDRLQALPLTASIEIAGRRVLLCHGTPTSNEDYVYPDATRSAWQALAVPGYDLVVCGHTHYPARWDYTGGHVVNPGSVGQPRNRVPGAHWALWDTGINAVELHVEQYDASCLIELCRKRDPNVPYLAEVLSRQ